ncbi:MAG: hypothetical protein NDJ94_00250 [Vicinamibacteria bacterium]|nr:hypothetical protein [Vicinamibacteria bacterium]
MSERAYFDLARKLLAAVGDPRSALAGGVAVGAHGYVRATRDVDIVVGIGLPEVQRRLAESGVETTLKQGDPLDGDFSCLKGRDGGVPFDIIPQLVEVAWDRTITLELGSDSIRVVDLGSLIALKLRAAGPRDLMDVAMLVLLHPEREAEARREAQRRRIAERLDAFLADPRLRAEAEEIRSS